MPAAVTFTRPAFLDTDTVRAPQFNAVAAVAGTVPDATSSTEGVIRIAGDLTGGAASPQLITLSGLTPGTYGATCDNYATLTVDAKGRVTSIGHRAPPDSGVAPGAYGASGTQVPHVTVDAKGRITAAANRDILQAVREAFYPVGEILITLRAGNPATWLGFGTWVAWGAGRALVGHDGADSDFNAAEKTGGAKTHTLTAAQIPAHTHTVAGQTISTTTAGSHSHLMFVAQYLGSGVSPVGAATHAAYSAGGDRDYMIAAPTSGTPTLGLTDTVAAHQHSVTVAGSDTGSVGSGSAHNNLQPYIVAFVWKRTA